jgi:hypothetical protein
MTSIRRLAVSIVCAVVLPSFIYAQDLSSYREFRIGTNLVTIAKQTGMRPSEATTIHQRTAKIQELTWHRFLSSSSQSDPVREVVFGFYNGDLFRIVVNYDPNRTEGLTDADMIEALSANYGAATRPTAKIVISSSSTNYSESENVLACWEDAQYSFNLFRFSGNSSFGMAVLSKRLDALAQAAIVEGARLDQQEAPQREIERQKRENEENRIAQEKTRSANKATFRP